MVYANRLINLGFHDAFRSRIVLSNNYSQVLFHYTTVEGALGILSELDFFVTDVRFMNDLSEVTHFDGFILEQLDDLLEKLEPNFDGKPFNQIKKFAGRIVSAILKEIEQVADTYTLSFSVPKGDFEYENGLLSQWRSYGADGGVVLELERQRFEELVDRRRIDCPANDYYYEMVTYANDVDRVEKIKKLFEEDLSEQFESFVTRLITRRKTIWETKSGESIETSVDIALKEDASIYQDIISAISKWAIFYKHEGFREEQEFRISVRRPLGIVPDKNVYFKVRRGKPTPYIRLFENKESLPISRLIIGPNQESKERSYAFSKFVGRRGLDVKVTISMIPFI